MAKVSKIVSFDQGLTVVLTTHKVALAFASQERGLIITRSGFDENALAMNFHVRQDMGGHMYGDRNSFTLSGLGEVGISGWDANLKCRKWGLMTREKKKCNTTVAILVAELKNDSV